MQRYCRASLSEQGVHVGGGVDEVNAWGWSSESDGRSTISEIEDIGVVAEDEEDLPSSGVELQVISGEIIAVVSTEEYGSCNGEVKTASGSKVVSGGVHAASAKSK